MNGKGKEAESMLIQGIKDDPNNPGSIMSLGVVYWKWNKKRESEALLLDLLHRSHFEYIKGDIISRFTTDIQQIELSMISSLRIFLKEPALMIGLFFILAYLSLELTVYTIVLIPIGGGIISYIANKLKIKTGYFH